MDQDQCDALIHRLERLERQVRRWKALGLAAVAALGIVALIGKVGTREAKAQETKEYNITVPKEFLEGYTAKSAPEIRAQRIILVDPSGRTRGRLQVSSGGTPSLELYGPSGKTHASLAVKGSGQPQLVLYDRLGRVLWKAP